MQPTAYMHETQQCTEQAKQRYEQTRFQESLEGSESPAGKKMKAKLTG